MPSSRTTAKRPTRNGCSSSLCARETSSPYDLYREAVRSYRRKADKLDIYRLQDYAEAIPRENSYLDRAMKEVL